MNDWRIQWQRNPRLRAGGFLIASLVWLYLLLGLADAVDALRAERRAMEEEIARLGALKSEQAWEGLRRDSLRVLAEQRQRCWREASEGRMQASLQDWLRGQLSAAGLVPRELSATVLAASAEGRAADGDDPMAELRLVKARATASFDPAALHRLLGALRLEPRWNWISRLTVDNGGRRQLELEVETLFVLTGEDGR